MYTTGLVLTALFAGIATTAPTDQYSAVQARDTDTFTLHVWNNCPSTKQVALYQVTSDFQMVQRSTPANVAPHTQKRIHAPYNALGMRLWSHAEWGTAAQWNVQALFEFGYSNHMGQDGTAYNLSVMEGSDGDMGIGAYPIPNGKGSKSCPAKTCFPWDCLLDQGWTNPGQVSNGSPADTVCYNGKTDFKVVFCP